jgi:hypothetical protein
MVSQHSISRIDPGPEHSGFVGSAAEVVDEQNSNDSMVRRRL